MSTRYTAMAPTADDPDGSVAVRSGRRVPLKMILIAILTLLLLATTAVAATFVVFYLNHSSSSSDSSPTSTPSPAPSSNVCQTEACFDLAVQILGAMDESADPCEDFYNFTCGNWDIFNHIRPGIPCTLSQCIHLEIAIWGELLGTLCLNGRVSPSLVPRLSFSFITGRGKESLVSTVCACSKFTVYFPYNTSFIT